MFNCSHILDISSTLSSSSDTSLYNQPIAASNNIKHTTDNLFDKEGIENIKINTSAEHMSNMHETTMLDINTLHTVPIYPIQNAQVNMNRPVIKKRIKKMDDFCDPLDYAKLLSSFYDAPKPDTPPAKQIPFWLDPIWSFTRPWSPKDNEVNVSNFLNFI